VTSAIIERKAVSTISDASQSPRDGIAASLPSQRRRAGGERIKATLAANRFLLAKLASIAVTLLVWDIYGRGVNPIFISYPTAILAVLPQMITSGELGSAFLESLGPFLLGWCAAIALGIIVGLLMGRYAYFDAVLDAQMMALYSAPTVALVPLFILWLGIGFSAKVAIIFLSAFFPIALNAYGGAKSVTTDLTNIGRVENAREDQIFTKIVIPASVPYIMTGIRLSVGRAVVGMVVAEMFTAIGGLGGRIVLYSSTYKTDRLFVIIIVLSALGVVLSYLTKRLEAAFLPWRM
jgi:ABC-type nitrate/sulfonate/bicarbonate transport system permease component